jgi:hypothetical protein
LDRFFSGDPHTSNNIIQDDKVGAKIKRPTTQAISHAGTVDI